MSTQHVPPPTLPPTPVLIVYHSFPVSSTLLDAYRLLGSRLHGQGAGSPAALPPLSRSQQAASVPSLGHLADVEKPSQRQSQVTVPVALRAMPAAWGLKLGR